MVLDLDLNDTPPEENLILEGNFMDAGHREVQAGEHWRFQSHPTIDVEAIDDEVVPSSPRSFIEARNKSKRNHRVIVVLDEDTEVHRGHSELTARWPPSCTKRRRVLPNQAFIDCDFYMNLEGTNKIKKNNVPKPPELPQSVPPPEAPTFSCPICIGQLVEETSTKCGHIFCKKCIMAAIAAQHKCPTCRQKLTKRNTFRVYLPSTR